MNALVLIMICALLAALLLSVTVVLTRRKGKKQSAVLCGGLALLLLAGAIWFVTPFRMLSAKADDVKSVTVFSGQTGQAATVTDAEGIEKIVGNMNSVKLKRTGLGMRMGYALKVTVERKNGSKVEYIVNSDDKAVRGAVQYEVCEGSIDFTALEKLLK